MCLADYINFIFFLYNQSLAHGEQAKFSSSSISFISFSTENLGSTGSWNSISSTINFAVFKSFFFA